MTFEDRYWCPNSKDISKDIGFNEIRIRKEDVRKLIKWAFDDDEEVKKFLKQMVK